MENGNGRCRMSPEELDKIIEKGKKLLALADSDNEHEAGLAMKMLGDMMAKYELHLSQFEASQQSKEEMGRLFVDGLTKTRRFHSWESQLASAVGKSFGCKVVLISRNVDQWKVAFLGRKTDLEIAIHFYQYLRGVVNRRGKFFQKGAPVEYATYCVGMTTSLSKRLQEMYEYKKEAMGSECTALVRTKKDVDDYTATIYPRLTTTYAQAPTGSREAYMQGIQHGNEVPLSRPVGAGADRNKIR